ncbi:hypothetical protein CCACVL1_27191 [Corchorus capsularis]|uniref:BURP domain-containing protein n=1 Tax=Corchorus capsularis TaxID=210143 RepID=A0A1R3GC10_COCAP|nr:hypothetical protein CCACVL1_27191 [Corchorus capsularis]
MCDHGNAVKDMKEKHSQANFHKSCDQAEDNTSSKSSYVTSLENKYKPGYGVEEAEQKWSSSSAFITKLESIYRPDYGVLEDEEKIARLESKYKPGYIAVDEVEERIVRLGNKYKPGYGVDEAEGKSSSSAYITKLESRYKPDYGVLEDEEKIARLESKYKPGYGVDEAEKSSSSAYITKLESKYKPAEGKSSSSAYIAKLESQYKTSYIVLEDDEKMAHLENKYKPDYGVDEAEEKIEEPHNMAHDHGHDDDIGSEDVGVFTVDDVRTFQVGRKLTTFFSIRKPSLSPGFLPRDVADSIPFSSSDIPRILQFFSISPDSPKGKFIKDTIRRCEVKLVKGETKICATSSESMLEFLKNAFGEADFQLISTSHPTMTTPILQSYTVMGPPREIESPRKVACHPEPYLYTIYMCHYDETETKLFKVPLVGDNGDKVDALIVCHMDTSAWSPKHAAFSLLGTKPGIPVCHVFTEGHGVWIQSSTKNVAAM